jgi:hypothetical protein
MSDSTFTPAMFIETRDGDLIKPERIESVRHWPPYKGEKDHRTQLRTVEGGIWELYRGESEQEAVAIRDEMKAKILAAILHPEVTK